MEEIIYNISLYLGIAGFILFLFSFLTGLRIIKVKAKYRLHKRVGVVGFMAVCVHGLVMCYFHFFN